VRIYVGTELVKTHPRKARGERSTDPSDYPPGRADCALRNADEILTKAHKHGEHVGVYAERLLDGPLPWTRMRQGYQLLRLCKRYGADRVDAMCRRALDFDVVDVPRVERMLKSAMRTEQDAVQEGKLKQLPLSPRFARDASAFGTRRSPEEV